MRKIRAGFLALSLSLGLAAVSGAATLNVPGAHRTVQETVGMASPGDTVLVGDGVYRENIIINKAITVRSANGAQKSVISAADPSLPVIKITDTEGVTLEGLGAEGSEDSGIMLFNVRNSVISKNVSVRNNIGISLYSSSENKVTGNAADRNVTYGIYLERSNRNKLEGNSADRNDDKGFFISYSDWNEIKGNSANLNTWNGVLLFSSHNNIIRENTALRNTYGIVLSDSPDNEDVDNTTLPNIFLILPVMLIYLGVLTYLLQKSIFKLIYRAT